LVSEKAMFKGDFITDRERAELESRVRRLRALDDRFGFVGVSDHIASRDGFGSCGLVGGELVARDV
jgi:hypothetical protein